MNLFGYEFSIAKRDKKNVPASVVPPENKDGSQVVVQDYAGTLGYYNIVNDTIDPQFKSDDELLKNYREASLYSDVDNAIEEIVNEAVNTDGGEEIVKINLENVKLSNSIKKQIADEFKNCLDLLEFNVKGPDIFRQWYIDGKLYYNALIDPKNLKQGIQELRYIDPRKIKKIRTIKKETDPNSRIEIQKIEKEFYAFNDGGIQSGQGQTIELSIDSVVYVTSGITDPSGKFVLSPIHKALKFVNILKSVEDAIVIYRITRAPERRIFYIDTGNLPPAHADKHLHDLMNRYKNKIAYDPTTGKMKDVNNVLSMMEDFWMPRRNGSNSTEITTLPGGQSLGNMEDVQYFQHKVWTALNVPIARMESQGSMISIGRSNEVSREEIRFNKYISKLRMRFNSLFNGLLRIQLLSKNIISQKDWDMLCKGISYIYNRDNFFAQLKENDVLMTKLNTVSIADQFVGKYFSKKFVQTKILNMTEDEINEQDKQIQLEMPPPEEMGGENEPSNLPDNTQSDGSVAQDQQNQVPDVSNNQPFGAQR